MEYFANGVIALLIALGVGWLFYLLTRRDLMLMARAFEGAGLISLTRKDGKITGHGVSLGANLRTSVSTKADLTVVPPSDHDEDDETPEERKKRHERILDSLIPPPLIPEYPDES